MAPNQSNTLHDPINLTQLAAKADERREQATALKRLSRIGWIAFGAGLLFTVSLSPLLLIATRASLISIIARIIMAVIGFGSVLTVIRTTGTAQFRRLRNALVLRQEANDLIRQLMPDLPESHHPLLAQKSRAWYWFYFAGLVIISLVVFIVGLYSAGEIPGKLLPAFPFIPFMVMLNLPEMILWTIWHDFWMGQSIRSIWRWIRHGNDPQRGLYCLVHGLILITLTIVPIMLLYRVGPTDLDLTSFGWAIIIFMWVYQSQLFKYGVYFPHDWITRPIIKGQMQKTLRRRNLLKTLRPYNPGLHQVNAIILSFSGRYVEAEQAYRYVLAENPPIQNQIMCLINLASALEEQRKYQEAITVLDVVMYLAPEVSLNYLNLAEIYLMTRSNPTRALEIIEVGLEQNHNLGTGREKSRFEGALWVRKAWALAELGQHQAAYDALQQAWLPANLKHASRSTQANMHYMTGRIYYLENQLDQAIQSFQQARKMHPAGAVAQRAETALNYLQAQHNQLNIDIA